MIVAVDKIQRFKLSEGFVDEYRTKGVDWGFGDLSYVTYKRTYARPVEGEDRTEEWFETCRRVIEGMFTVQKAHCYQLGLPWDNRKAQRSAQEAYDRMYNFKWLPPGRGLWMMGTDFIYKKGGAALNNCGFTSTDNIDIDFAQPFCWQFGMSMLGVGVGFCTRGAGKIVIKEPRASEDPYVIEDSREGWVEALRCLLTAFTGKGSLPSLWDASKVRPKGSLIKGFGGIASGPEPLIEMLESVESLLRSNIDNRITSEIIVDVMNLVGKCVVSGGVRRTAQIAFGEPDDNEFMELKRDMEKLSSHRWASNNSIFANVGMDYSIAAESTKVNGEPGYAWLDNMRKYGRMKDPATNADRRVMGGNPCFVGDTLIAVADGRGAVPIRQLVGEGKDVPVYSLNSVGEVEIKWARNPRKTRSDAEILRVYFEDGTHLDVTPDHKMMLLNGDQKQAKDLSAGDSLPRFIKKYEKISKNNPSRYIRVNCNTLDGRKDRIFEHRLIAKFNDPKTFDEMYDENKTSGWISGGLVVHHKDYDSMNNSPDNLQWMTFKEHCKFHGDRDQQGENNPMFGRTHSEKTKALIGANTKSRWQDDIERSKMVEGFSNYLDNGGREESSERMKIQKAKWNKDHYLQCEAETDLDTLWIEDKLFVKKKCKQTDEEFIVPWGKRDQMFASIEIANQFLNTHYVERRKIMQARYFEDRQRDILHKQIMILKDLEKEVGEFPLKKEWEKSCKEKGVPFRFNKDSDNPYVMSGFRELKKISKDYNHRVKSIEYLSSTEDVYNLTVDDNYTVAIVTSQKERSMEGIFTFQCLEQSLEDNELCCLVETFPAHHDSIEDYIKTLKFAYMYAKTVTLIPTHDQMTNAVMMRNRRIGCSMSGIVQNIQKIGLRNHLQWCDEGYEYIQELDTIYSEWLCIPRSIKTTSIKPSGTVSLVAGATPGLHHGQSEYAIRRVRFADTSPIWKACERAGYHVEDCVYAPYTKVVSFPTFDPMFERGEADVSMWEQINIASLHQEYWADNQVSCTVKFQSHEADDIQRALEMYEHKLKGISFLPQSEHGYDQAPYEEITKEQYDAMMTSITPVDLSMSSEREAEDKFCDGESCNISFT